MTAADPGTGVGGKHKRRGVRKLSCSRFASAPSSQGSFILSLSGTDFSSATRASPAATAPQPPFLSVCRRICTRDRQSLEESSEENCSPKERHRALENPSIQPLAPTNKHRPARLQSGLQRLLPAFQAAWLHGGAGRQLCAFPRSQHQQVQP